jgi:hypothetical protein
LLQVAVRDLTTAEKVLPEDLDWAFNIVYNAVPGGAGVDAARGFSSARRRAAPGGILSITEEFLNPDYPLVRTTTRWAREAGFELAEWHGNRFVYTLSLRKPA